MRPGRLRSTADFQRVLGGGRRSREGRVVLYVLATGGPTRTGFVVGRSVGGAVDRNRARRILREAWRVLAPRIGEGYDVVFVARPEIEGAKTQDLVEDIARAFRARGMMTE